MYIDEKPAYVVGDPDYDGLDDIDDIMVVRLLKTHHELVTQRFPNISIQKQWKFHHFKNRTEYYDLKSSLICRMIEKKIEDPAHFVAFVFEMWASPKHFEYRAKKVSDYLGKDTAGVKYPSLRYLILNGVALLEEFSSIPNYKPSQFIPSQDLSEFDHQVMEHMVERWCLANDKTVEEYWLTPRHLFPPFLDWQWIDYADSLWACDEVLKEKLGFSVRELKDFLVTLEQVTEDYHKACSSVPSFVEKIEWEEDNEIDQERIEIYREAVEKGVDVLSEQFQQSVEEVINPVDNENSDTLAWYFFGLGEPRHRDGEEVNVDESIGPFEP